MKINKDIINIRTTGLFLLVIIVYLATAYNSTGYYHADEQYQVIEFAGLKLGTHQPEDVAWEFHKKIRPMIQPTLCFIIFSGLNAVNITDPYSQAFVLRLISALFSIVAIWFFIRSTYKMVDEKYWLSYCLLSFLLWFIPLISVRFSSETWSGLFFICGLSVQFNQNIKIKKTYWIGVLFGLSFLFRFQMAFAILGFGLWLLFVNKTRINDTFKIIVGFLIVLAFGVVIDFWFYGQWVFSPWNYFYSNIVEDAASSFGVSPWMYYLQQIAIMPSLLIGIIIFCAIVVLILFKHNHFLVWIIIPFILIHSLIPHKEERFLFPLVFLLPLVFMVSYQTVINLIHSNIIKNSLKYALITFFVIINTIGLVAVSQKSAGMGRMKITQFIHENYRERHINLIHCSWANPYNPWHGLPTKFYLEKNMNCKRINSLCELNDSLIMRDAVNLLITRKVDLQDQNCVGKIKERGFVFKIQSIQPWIEKLNLYYKGINGDDILMLYLYKGN